MSSIRKIKRRAMARMSEPVMELRFSGVTLALLRGMTSIERENVIRSAIRSYVKNWRKG
jgi:hypothetical protein